jgi:hypothetical protein
LEAELSFSERQALKKEKNSEKRKKDRLARQQKWREMKKERKKAILEGREPSPMSDGEGSDSGGSGSSSDDERADYAYVLQAERAKTKFLSKISHFCQAMVQSLMPFGVEPNINPVFIDKGDMLVTDMQAQMPLLSRGCGSLFKNKQEMNECRAANMREETDNGEDIVTTFAIVSGDEPAALTKGIPNLWALLDHTDGKASKDFDTSAYKLTNGNSAPSDCVVHSTGLVQPLAVLETCYAILKSCRPAKRVQSAPTKAAKEERETATREAEQRILATLADSYRVTWTLPHTREVMASCPQLLYDAADDIWASVPPGHPLRSIAAEERRALCRLNMQVQHDYQAQLWGVAFEADVKRAFAHQEERRFQRFGSIAILVVNPRDPVFWDADEQTTELFQFGEEADDEADAAFHDVGLSKDDELLDRELGGGGGGRAEDEEADEGCYVPDEDWIQKWDEAGNEYFTHKDRGEDSAVWERPMRWSAPEGPQLRRMRKAAQVRAAVARVEESESRWPYLGLKRLARHRRRAARNKKAQLEAKGSPKREVGHDAKGGVGIAKGGGQVLSMRQLGFVDDCLALQGVRVLIVLSNSPMVWDPQESKARAGATRAQDDHFDELRESKWRKVRDEKLRTAKSRMYVKVHEKEAEVEAAKDQLESSFPDLTREARFKMSKAAQTQYMTDRNWWIREVEQKQKALEAETELVEAKILKLEGWEQVRAESQEAHALALSELDLRPVRRANEPEDMEADLDELAHGAAEAAAAETNANAGQRAGSTIKAEAAEKEKQAWASDPHDDVWGRHLGELVDVLHQFELWKSSGDTGSIVSNFLGGGTLTRDVASGVSEEQDAQDGIQREVVLVSGGQHMGVETLLRNVRLRGESNTKPAANNVKGVSVGKKKRGKRGAAELQPIAQPAAAAADADAATSEEQSAQAAGAAKKAAKAKKEADVAKKEAEKRAKEEEGCIMRQLVLGPITGAPKAKAMELGGDIGPVYSFTHRPLLEQRHFGLLQVGMKHGSLAVASALVPVPKDRVKITVGPVIGLVTSTSAIVLLEVDMSRPITCVLTDTFDPSSTHTLTKCLPANAPRVFNFCGLRAERTYKVRFSGPANASERPGVVRTLPASPPSMSFVAIARDRPQKFVPEGTLWDQLWNGAKSGRPGFDVALHIDCQVDSGVAFDQSRCLCERLEKQWADATGQETSEGGMLPASLEETRERLRDVYRFNFNVPCTREFLARGSHLMFGGDSDLLGHFHRSNALENSGLIQRLSREVRAEYQRQLYDPTYVATDTGDADQSQGRGGSEQAYFTSSDAPQEAWLVFGDVGILRLDTTGMRVDQRARPKQMGSEEVIANSMETEGEAGGVDGATDAPGAAAAAGDSSDDDEDDDSDEEGEEGQGGGDGDGDGDDDHGYGRYGRRFLSKAQWAFIRESLRNAKGLRTLLVITEVPLVWHAADELHHLLYSSNTGGENQGGLLDHWVFHKEEQLELLRLLFEWQFSSKVIEEKEADKAAAAACTLPPMSSPTATAAAQAAKEKKDAEAEIQRIYAEAEEDDGTNVGARSVMVLTGGARVGMRTAIRPAPPPAGKRAGAPLYALACLPPKAIAQLDQKTQRLIAMQQRQGGVGGCGSGSIHDNTTNKQGAGMASGTGTSYIEQVCVGPITDVPLAGSELPERQGTLGLWKPKAGGRQAFEPEFNYLHTPLQAGAHLLPREQQKRKIYHGQGTFRDHRPELGDDEIDGVHNYAIVTAYPEQLMPHFGVHYVTPTDGHVLATVGPVIGNVTTDSGNVMIEIDRNCSLLGVLTDVFTGRVVQEHRKLMTANVPQVFAFEYLDPGVKYEFSCPQLFKCHTHTGSFTTRHERQPQMLVGATFGSAHHEQLGADSTNYKPNNKAQSSVWAGIYSTAAAAAAAQAAGGGSALAMGGPGPPGERHSNLRCRTVHMLNAAAQGAAHVEPCGGLDGNVWTRLEAMLEPPQQGLELMLHLGRSVSMAGAFDDADFAELRRPMRRLNAKDEATVAAAAAEESDAAAEGKTASLHPRLTSFMRLTEEQWEAAEEEVLHRLRDRYRTQYCMPHAKTILAHCPQLMLHTPSDVYEGMARAVGMEGHPLGERMLRRCARRVWREYVHALWDPAVLQHQDLASDQDQQYFFRFGDIGVLMVDQMTSRLRPDGTKALDELLLSREQVQRVAEAFSTPGMLCLLFVTELPLIWLSPEQIDHKIHKSPATAPDANPADWTEARPEEMEVTAADGYKGGLKREECWLRDQWGYHEDLLIELLENMFEWQAMGTNEGRHREVILLSGGTHIGCETEVRDPRTNLTLKQIVVGPSADAPLPEFEPELSGEIGDRYAYTHTPYGAVGAAQPRCAALLRLFCDSRRLRVAEASLIGAKPTDMQKPTVLVGPIIGKVSSTAMSLIGRRPKAVANVLFEVDREFPVTCEAFDVMTGERFRLTELMPARKPYVFRFTELRPKRRYRVRLVGACNARSQWTVTEDGTCGDAWGYDGSFTTPAASPTGEEHLPVTPEQAKQKEEEEEETNGKKRGKEENNSNSDEDSDDDTTIVLKTKLCLAFVGGDNPAGLPAEAGNMWTTLQQRLANPWHGIDAVVHVGSQVNLAPALYACRRWLIETWQARASDAEACAVAALDNRR